ncbi:unnamed protein product [Symbiodinium natans]|uniref:Pentatricopeptide repeat-containing protein, chloroplastic n=1 Tax=Symbiodinium natans TaxID=878477 RepID=A0A812NVB7_9DINO|nr:unnamed protein product [Symbiodinium natans]
MPGAAGAVEPNMVTYNSAMSGFERVAGWPQALDLLRCASLSRQKLDEVSFNTAASVCSSEGGWLRALDLLQCMALRSLPRRRVGLNAGLKALRARWERGCLLLRLEQPDLVAFNTAIASLTAESWARGLDLVGVLPEARLCASLATYVSALTLLGQGSAWRRAVEGLDACRLAGQEPTLALRSSLLSALSKVLRWTEALDIFAKVTEVDDRCRASILQALPSRWARALGLLSGPPPGNRSLAAAAGACQESWALCLELLGWLGARGSQDFAATTSVAIAAADKASQWEPALGLLGRASPRTRDEVTCTAVLSAARASGAWPMALALLAAMEPGRLHPTDVTFNVAVAAASSGQRWALALRLALAATRGANAALQALRDAWRRALARLALMPACGVLADCISFNSLLAALGLDGRWRWALACAGQMPRHELSPDELTLGACISACAVCCGPEGARA